MLNPRTLHTEILNATFGDRSRFFIEGDQEDRTGYGLVSVDGFPMFSMQAGSVQPYTYFLRYMASGEFGPNASDGQQVQQIADWENRAIVSSFSNAGIRDSKEIKQPGLGNLLHQRVLGATVLSGTGAVLLYQGMQKNPTRAAINNLAVNLRQGHARGRINDAILRALQLGS